MSHMGRVTLGFESLNQIAKGVCENEAIVHVYAALDPGFLFQILSCKLGFSPKPGFEAKP